jgi:sucrose-6-phosphate hydrolase SacC (GH32 family)
MFCISKRQRIFVSLIGAPFWGHVVSRDLARWTWLPPALLPDTPYDYNGCWSGAATVADGNNPVLTYTGAACSAVFEGHLSVGLFNH